MVLRLRQTQQQRENLTIEVRSLFQKRTAADSCISTVSAQSVCEMHQRTFESMNVMSTRITNIIRTEKQLVDVKGLGKPQMFDNVQVNHVVEVWKIDGEPRGCLQKSCTPCSRESRSEETKEHTQQQGESTKEQAEERTKAKEKAKPKTSIEANDSARLTRKRLQ